MQPDKPVVDPAVRTFAVERAAAAIGRSQRIDVTVLTHRRDYWVLRCISESSRQSVVLKPAGPDCPYSVSFARTAAVTDRARLAGVPVSTVLEFVDSYRDGPWRCLVQEFVGGHEWRHLRRTLSVRDAASADDQLADVVVALHSVRFDGFGPLGSDELPTSSLDLLTALEQRAMANIADECKAAAFASLLRRESQLFTTGQRASLCHDDLRMVGADRISSASVWGSEGKGPGLTLLLCGGSGALGGAIARRLTEHSVDLRVLVRPDRDASALRDMGAQVVVGDLTDPGSLAAAVQGVDVVVTTANAIGRLLAGAKDVSIAGVDDEGNAALIEAAEQAEVARFVFVSISGLTEQMAARAPLAMAKLRTERRLAASPMRHVIVRPEKFQEIWLSPQTGNDPAKKRAVIFGKGQVPESYVAIDDMAPLCVRMATDADPPSMVTFGGPQVLTRLEVVDEFERAFGATFRRIRVPRPVLAVGAKALSRVKPEVASVLGMALHHDLHGAVGDSQPLEQLGITPRTTSAYIAELAGAI